MGKAEPMAIKSIASAGRSPRASSKSPKRSAQKSFTTSPSASQSPRKSVGPDDDEGTISDGDSYLFGVLDTFDQDAAASHSFLVEISDSDEDGTDDPYKQLEARVPNNKKPLLENDSN